MLGAAAAYGGLVVKGRSTAARVEAVKNEHDADISEIRENLHRLSVDAHDHRLETNDRLARIETKLDNLLSRE